MGPQTELIPMGELEFLGPPREAAKSPAAKGLPFSPSGPAS